LGGVVEAISDWGCGISFPNVEFVDVKGDKWEVRTCDDDDNCVVISHCLSGRHGVDVEVGDLHIPLESVHKLAMACESLSKIHNTTKKWRNKSCPPS
jgi:hypothetical protein